MFNEIGKKIKRLASTLCKVQIAIYVIAAIVFLGLGLISIVDGNEDSAFFWILIGLACAIIGPLLAWLSTIILYGYGELIDKTGEIEKNTRPANTAPTANVNPTYQSPVNANPMAANPAYANPTVQSDRIQF